MPSTQQIQREALVLALEPESGSAPLPPSASARQWQ
jgi:hypothetical protein